MLIENLNILLKPPHNHRSSGGILWQCRIILIVWNYIIKLLWNITDKKYTWVSIKKLVDLFGNIYNYGNRLRKLLLMIL